MVIWVVSKLNFFFLLLSVNKIYNLVSFDFNLSHDCIDYLLIFFIHWYTMSILVCMCEVVLKGKLWLFNNTKFCFNLYLADDFYYLKFKEFFSKSSKMISWNSSSPQINRFKSARILWLLYNMHCCIHTKWSKVEYDVNKNITFIIYDYFPLSCRLNECLHSASLKKIWAKKSLTILRAQEPRSINLFQTTNNKLLFENGNGIVKKRSFL